MADLAVAVTIDWLVSSVVHWSHGGGHGVVSHGVVGHGDMGGVAEHDVLGGGEELGSGRGRGHEGKDSDGLELSRFFFVVYFL